MANHCVKKSIILFGMRKTCISSGRNQLFCLFVWRKGIILNSYLQFLIQNYLLSVNCTCGRNCWG